MGDKGDKGNIGNQGLRGPRGADGAVNLFMHEKAKITSNSTKITALETDVASLKTTAAGNTTDIATNSTNILTNTSNISSNSTGITQNTSRINTNFTDIGKSSLCISGNTTNTTNNTNEIAAVKVLANTSPTLTLTKGIKKGKTGRKAGDYRASGNNNILISIVAHKTGKFLALFGVVIQPDSTEYGNGKKSGWYYSWDATNKKLKTWLYKGSSNISSTEVITDGDIYAHSFPHHIIFKEVMDLTSGDVLRLKSWCDGFGDNYSLLYFHAIDAQIFLLGF